VGRSGLRNYRACLRPSRSTVAAAPPLVLSFLPCLPVFWGLWKPVPPSATLSQVLGLSVCAIAHTQSQLYKSLRFSCLFETILRTHNPTHQSVSQLSDPQSSKIDIFQVAFNSAFPSATTPILPSPHQPHQHRPFYILTMPDSVWFCVSLLTLAAQDIILTYLQPSCGYGPLNPAIDAACANCGWYPGRPQRRTHHKAPHKHHGHTHDEGAEEACEPTVSWSTTTAWDAGISQPSQTSAEFDFSRRIYTAAGFHHFIL
jgi:hypothetical protein